MLQESATVDMAKFVVILNLCLITALSNARDEFTVELKPRTVRVPLGDNVTLECSTSYNLPLIPMWEIDDTDYRVTDLPLGYKADGANISFRAVNSTTIRCFFNVFDVSTADFEVVYSNNVTVTTTPSTDTPDFLDGVEECNPVNITLFVLDNEEIYISLGIEYFNPSGCSFLVTVSNCSQPDTPSLNCTYYASKQYVRSLRLNQCLGRIYSYGHGTTIDIKWNDDECIEGDNDCSSDLYIPELTETVVIRRDMDGLFANLANPYCPTNLRQVTSLLLCFESTPSQDYDGCFDEEGNEHFYLEQHSTDNSTWLGVRGINPSLNGTIISIFCIIDDCPPSLIDANIFNFVIINECSNCSPNATCEEGECICKPGYIGDGLRCNPVDVICENCSQHATCIEGECMCKPGYTGDGLRCTPNAMCDDICSQNAACEEGQCVCKPGYTGNGMICNGKKDVKLVGIVVGCGLAFALIVVGVLVVGIAITCLYQRCRRENNLGQYPAPAPLSIDRKRDHEDEDTSSDTPLVQPVS